MLKVPRARSELEWVTSLVEEQGLLLHPGFFYDFPSEGHLALSLLMEPGLFREAIRRFSSSLGDAGGEE